MKKFLCNVKKGFCDNDICNNCDFADGSGGEYRKVPVTNSDRIRAMSDEELSEFLCNIRSCDADCNPCKNCVANKHCRAGHTGMIDWLKQPAEEG